MKTIWKFKLQTTDIQTISMPVGAEILCVQKQYNDPVIWAIVNDQLPKEDRTIRIYGTGHPCDLTKDQYIGTYQSVSGQLIYHVFEAHE